ncbi:uncharacterized protein LOC105778882 [Gossypium raimondii]|uniref:uncharacterized protein LOC105778882 n=1 Tax=Gossypium raimondii TaxID=29730 RepID=UPI00063AAB84|nr:uncharacterized protein LOC105778882 [Gossypium raimondii]
MAANNNTVSVSQSAIPVFNRNNYKFWSIKMKTLFKSQELWDLVENGYPDDDGEAKLRENQKKDNKALFFIQQAVHESIFSKIAGVETVKEAWTTLHMAYQGTSKVVTMKLQTLHPDFETLQMKSGESVQDYLTRAAVVVNQMKYYGEQVTNQTTIEKVLRSLTPKFDHVVAAIKESKDLATYSFDELQGSLQSHEARLNRTNEKSDEKAFQVMEEPSKQQDDSRNATYRRGYHGRGGYRGRGRGVEHDEQIQMTEKQK